jgi:hypothetical protein
MASVAGVVWLVVWCSFGFRYSGFSRQVFVYDWARFTHDDALSGAVDLAREHRVLPEPFLFGFLYTARSAEQRRSFLDGVISHTGRVRFFPLAFLYKTPPAALLLLALSTFVLLAWWLRERPGCGVPGGPYSMTPVLLLGGIYVAVALSSDLNIGVRHLLPAHACAFIACGVLGRWSLRRPAPAIAVSALLAWSGVETVATWPHYLAYFSPFVGGPARGHEHLVDSSLDWGQDLNGLRDWLERDRARRATEREPVFLSYFGPTPPSYFGIDATLLPGFEHPLEPPEPAVLEPGTYCVSASMLESVYLRRFPGRWCESYEKQYRFLRQFHRRFRAAEGDELERERFVAGVLGEARQWLGREKPPSWETTIGWIDRAPEVYWERYWKTISESYAYLQASRLFAYLRRRAPDGHVGYSIWIYRLDDAAIDAVVNGPPPELAEDALERDIRDDVFTLVPPRFASGVPQ